MVKVIDENSQTQPLIERKGKVIYSTCRALNYDPIQETMWSKMSLIQAVRQQRQGLNELGASLAYITRRAQSKTLSQKQTKLQKQNKQNTSSIILRNKPYMSCLDYERLKEAVPSCHRLPGLWEMGADDISLRAMKAKNLSNITTHLSLR